MPEDECEHRDSRSGTVNGRWGIRCTRCGAEQFHPGYWGARVGKTVITEFEDTPPKRFFTEEQEHGR